MFDYIEILKREVPMILEIEGVYRDTSSMEFTDEEIDEMSRTASALYKEIIVSMN